MYTKKQKEREWEWQNPSLIGVSQSTSEWKSLEVVRLSGDRRNLCIQCAAERCLASFKLLVQVLLFFLLESFFSDVTLVLFSFCLKMFVTMSPSSLYAAFFQPHRIASWDSPASLLFNKLKRSKSSSVTDASEIRLRGCTPTRFEVGEFIP